MNGAETLLIIVSVAQIAFGATFVFMSRKLNQGR